MKDYTNQIHGCWKVLERDKNPKSKSHETFWLCECQNCGAIKSVRKTDLDKNPRSCNNCKGQLTKSCGCLSKSSGELKIEQCLQNYNYQTQYKVSLCHLISLFLRMVNWFDGEQHDFLGGEDSKLMIREGIIFAASTISLLFVFPIMTTPEYMTELISSCSENKK